jgi:trans-aconitate 2-methyltransferase
VHPGQVAGTRWDANLYLRFSDHRLRPALDLLQRVPLESPGVIYDLGCGTGNITRLIAERWPAARVYGIDNSTEMLEKAAAVSGTVQWVEADIHHWQPEEPPDLIYSNAALHWVPDHRRLFPRLAGLLEAGGCLAVQMPLNWGAPSHRLMRETLADGGPKGTPLGTEALRQAVARDWVEGAEAYFDLLSGRGGSVDIWETEYLQVLDGTDPVVEWMKATALRPILMDLDDAQRALFLAEYARRLRTAYPLRADGHTHFPFRRLFMIATV